MTASDHFLRCQDVSFLFSGVDDDSTVTSYCSHDKSLSLMDCSRLTGMSYFVRSAKNDKVGRGNQYHVERRTVSNTTSFDVVLDACLWAQSAAYNHEDDPFLSMGGAKPWFLGYDILNNYIKSIAVAFGFDPKFFSTHSVRIGGASILAAAGMPAYSIQLMGRWKSSAFMLYIFRSVELMNTCFKALSDASVFSNSDFVKRNPQALRR